MFFATFKNTIKNIVRAPTFWMVLMIIVLDLVDVITQPSFGGYTSADHTEFLLDTDPRYVVGFNTYIKKMANSANFLMRLTMPFLISVTTVLVLNRDYGDNFYEIEKAAGIKTRHYLLGRLAALAMFHFVLGLLVDFAYFHTYIFTRGGVSSMDMMTYLTDSTVRILRIYVFTALPGMFFYIAFTYFLGALFRSGIPAAIVSIGYVLFNSAVYTRIRFRIDPRYGEYLKPYPDKLLQYFYRYDTDSFEDTLHTFDVNLTKVVSCIGFFVCLVVVYTAIAYLRTRKRDR